MSHQAERLCGCSFIHAHQTLAQGLDLVQQFGFAHVDIGIGGANAHFQAEAAAQNPQRYADEVQRETEARGLTVNECFVLNFGPPINTPDSAARKRTRELFGGLCDFARRADFRSVMLIAGPEHSECGRKYSQELAASALCELAEIAGEHGLLLNLEADCDSCVHTPEAARQLCERVPHLGLTLDHSHFICQGIAPERIEMLYPFARHVHVRQSAPGHIVAPANEGAVDFPDVLRKLKSSGYSGLYCVEYLSLTPGDAARREAETQTHIMKERMTQYLEQMA